MIDSRNRNEYSAYRKDERYYLGFPSDATKLSLSLEVEVSLVLRERTADVTHALRLPYRYEATANIRNNDDDRTCGERGDKRSLLGHLLRSKMWGENLVISILSSPRNFVESEVTLGHCRLGPGTGSAMMMHPLDFESLVFKLHLATTVLLLLISRKISLRGERNRRIVGTACACW